MGVPDEELADPGAVPEDLRCPLCFQVLQDPVEGRCCQNPFCRPCLSEALGRDQRCPLCRGGMHVEDMQVAHRTIRTRLGMLMRRCPRPGCSWTGLLEAPLDHDCLPVRLEQALAENVDLEGKLAKNRELEVKLEEKERELESEMQQKDAKISELEGRLAEFEQKATERGGLLQELLHLHQRLVANDDVSASSASGANTSGVGTDAGEDEDAPIDPDSDRGQCPSSPRTRGAGPSAGTEAPRDDSAGADEAAASPDRTVEDILADMSALVAEAQGSQDPQDRGIIDASIVHEHIYGSSYHYESRETTLAGVLRWCLYVPEWLQSDDDHPFGPSISVGVAADGSESGDYLAVISSEESSALLSGQYIEVVADMAHGRVVFAVGATRQSVREVSSREVPTGRAVKLSCTTYRLYLQNPDAAGADVAFEFLLR